MFGQRISDEDVVAGMRAVVIATGFLLRRLSDPQFLPQAHGGDEQPVVIDVEEGPPDAPPCGRTDRLRGLARRGGRRARSGVASGLGRLTANRPGSPGWEALDPDRRAGWWLNTVGRVTAAVAALPGLAGVVGDRVPVKDLVSAAGQALLLCAIAHEYGVHDTDDRVVLLAGVILQRDLTPAVARVPGRGADREAAEVLVAEVQDAPMTAMARDWPPEPP